MRRLARTDDGAVAVIVAIMMLVLLGMLALVLDVGALYAKKRHLQNGADSAVRAVAMDCAKGACGTYTATASNYTNLNDDTVTPGEPAAPTTVVGCGTSAGSLTNPCTASSSYAKVTANKVMTNNLAGLVGFNPTSNVIATAVAHWGPAAGLISEMPVTMSLCEWNSYTAGGTSFAAPPFPPYPAVKTVYFHGNSQAAATPCPASPSGQDLSGGFGWVQEACVAGTVQGSTLPEKPGDSPPCPASTFSNMLGQIVHLPVYDYMTGSGNNGAYHIAGYAAFYITGYYFNAGGPTYRKKSIVNNQYPCNGNNTCIEGFFTRDLSPNSGTVGTGPNMGVSIIQMIS